MNKFMLGLMGIRSMKPISGNLIMEVDGVNHNVEFSNGNMLKIEGPHGKKLGDLLKKVGVDLVLREKSDSSRVYQVKEG